MESEGGNVKTITKEVRGCVGCLFAGNEEFFCNYYARWLDDRQNHCAIERNQKPDFCHVTKIIIEEAK